MKVVGIQSRLPEVGTSSLSARKLSPPSDTKDPDAMIVSHRGGAQADVASAVRASKLHLVSLKCNINISITLTTFMSRA